MPRYRHIVLKEQIRVTKIYSFHYNELNKDYVYPGERHKFWEFLYVDKGEVEVVTGPGTFLLKQGDIVFYSPNEFHSLRCNGKVPPNIFIVAFDCPSEPMRFFTQKSLSLGNDERKILSRMIEEGNRLFAVPITRPRPQPAGPNSARAVKHHLTRKAKPPFASEQLIKIYLEMLLIQLIRNGQERTSKPKLTAITKEKEQLGLAEQIVAYLEAHIAERPTLEKLCNEFSLSKTHLRAIFREHTGVSIMEYIVRLRTDLAKQMIREETRNLTEIAEQLGYSSIHYFSRQFKQTTGMSPSEYLKTVQARV